MRTIIVATSEKEGNEKLSKALDAGISNIDVKYISSWKDTRLVGHLDDVKFKNILQKICGDTIFQGSIENPVDYAYEMINNNLKRSMIHYYTDIRPGDIWLEPPTYDECVERIYQELLNDIKFYRKQGVYLDIRDDWADSDGKKRCSADVTAKNTPRFIGVPMSETDFLKKQALQCEGVLTEGHVISYMNKNGCCPECCISGKIGWCESAKEKTNSFRDAICMNCYDNGTTTLFEIKSRWEKSIASKSTIFAGDYIALNTLIGMDANVYIVVSSRDTGTVRMGKITFAFMKTNERFLYSVQEKLGWGSPSTTVKCGYGMTELKTKMEPLVDILTREYCESVGKNALKRLKLQPCLLPGPASNQKPGPK